MTEEPQRIIPINIEDEMRGAYIDYSMSVIISRALPDVRDGLKPVHRRVLYGMSELGVSFNRAHKKSARIVGEVLGKYHPHGDSSVYDTMVRMAQEWSLRYPLVDGQGNFGSVDGDSPAAMRYTEARLKRIADELLGDLDKNTVDFQPNFDDSLQEPSVLPAKLPNLLVNGTTGIAVGMATNMAPHNLTEVVNGIIAYLADPDITVDGLMEFVTAPDFPTGGIIYGYEGVKQALRTGRGRVVVRAKATIETYGPNQRERIIVTEIPYMVNKATMIQKTAELINDKQIEGISDLRDESDRDGMRIVYEVKTTDSAAIVLNHLYKKTQLQSSFGVNNVALVKGRPLTLNLRDLIHHFVDHRQEVVIRRTQYELAEARKRAHILEGLLRALDYLDQVIILIRAAPDPDAARQALMRFFEDKPFARSTVAGRLLEDGVAGQPLGLSDVQARAILDMRLQRLTGLERDKLEQEYDELAQAIQYFLDVLASAELRSQIIRDELIDLRDRFGDARRTAISYDAADLEDEDLIEEAPMVVTISNVGYIKRTALAEYRAQGRGGIGARGVGTAKEEDFNEHLFVASTHAYLLFFTEQGRCFWKKVHQIAEGGKTTKGQHLKNVLDLGDDKVRAVLPVRNLVSPDYLENTFLVFCTEQGVIKKTTLEAYSRPRTAGIIAISINDGDRLLDVCLTNGSSDIVMALRSGRAIRFPETNVRPMGRGATGVRGISLHVRADEDDTDETEVDGSGAVVEEETSEEAISSRDRVVGMVCVSDPELETLLVISEKGYGKRSAVGEYRTTKRGGKGIKTMQVTEKTGRLVAIKNVTENDDLMIINRSGITIRTAVAGVPVLGRATQGVRVIRLGEGDEISSVAHVASEDIAASAIEEAETVGGEEGVAAASIAVEADDTTPSPADESTTE
ncbi:MAG: DNA gyrase subunit A [Hymenobacteraceae bacterium]|nr:DNA gyrase subunit A [Hymenobacteraceae bacterium]